jgi:apolipoprotein D and lipocalin family protein
VIGKAYFVDDSDLGKLKVSFWGPFYSSYNIIVLDKKNYSYSMVCGPNKSYLLILAREPHMKESLKLELMNRAKDMGFKTDKMIHVTH